MKKFEDIRALIADDLKEFHKVFRKTIKTDIRLLNAINSYILRKKGKQLRPVLVLLSAKMFGGDRQRAFVASSLVELFHTATLLHDDVVDDAPMRRGIFSVYGVWKSKIAILVGDFFLSRSMLLALKNKDYQLLEIISKAVEQISEGELLQLDKSRKYKTTEEQYMAIIRKKTASLFASCTKAGALAGGANKEEQEALYNYGMALGIAFQIQDDLLDFDKTNRMGKVLYNDLKERKMTLPIIYALQESRDAKKSLRIFKKKHKSKSELEYLVRFVRENGGIEYTEEKMQYYRTVAVDSLALFPESQEKKALIALAYFATQRKK